MLPSDSFVSCLGHRIQKPSLGASFPERTVFIGYRYILNQGITGPPAIP